MSGNVWSCADYEILRVEQKSDNTEYKVTLQRLPESSYPQYTVINMLSNEVDEDGIIKFPHSLALSDFLANVIPSVNAAIAADDAESFTNLS
jgi:hypothetical protein